VKKARWLIWAAVLFAGIATFASQRIAVRETSSVEADFGRVPAFSLTNQLAKPVTDRDLAGKVWVASFVFTRCATVCPMLTARFRALQDELSDLKGVAYVSISVDPEYDTPTVLAAYAERFGADEKQWQFLTGPLSDIERTVVAGFKIHIGDRKKSASDPTLMEIMHGEHFVLVDRSGQIRGYFQSDDAGRAELARALRSLSVGPKRP